MRLLTKCPVDKTYDVTTASYTRHQSSTLWTVATLQYLRRTTRAVLLYNLQFPTNIEILKCYTYELKIL